jgi:SAM-dependent methyltransferase
MYIPYRYKEAGKLALGWLITNGQTARWVSEKVLIREILTAEDFRSFLGQAAKGTSADVGCAGGRYIVDLLAPRFACVTGIEYIQTHVDHARERIAHAGLSQRVRVSQGRAEQLPLEDNSTDFVLCTQVLEHLPSPAAGVAEINRILRPKGRAILSIPIPPDPVPNPEHLHKDFFPPRLDEMVGEQGLTILRRDYCMYAITRAVGWMIGTLRIPLPLNPLIRLEQATSKLIAWPNPHTYVCVVEKP